MNHVHVTMTGAGLALLLAQANALAQTSLVAEKTATAKTDVVAEGSQKALGPEVFAASEESVLKIAAGSSVMAGNANSVNFTAAGNLRLRRQLNQLTLDLAANWGMAAVPNDAGVSVWDDVQQNVENYQGRLRYDRFLTERWALFSMLQGRRDRFQGYDLRLNFDPGLAYYIIQQEAQHLRLEAGYDLQYDVRTALAVTDNNVGLTPADPGYLYPEIVRHGMRFDAAYDVRLNQNLSFATELEFLMPFDFDPFPYRLNWTNGLTANLSTRFAFVTAFTLRYDNAPIGRQNTDILASLNLSYTLL